MAGINGSQSEHWWGISTRCCIELRRCIYYINCINLQPICLSIPVAKYCKNFKFYESDS